MTSVVTDSNGKSEDHVWTFESTVLLQYQDCVTLELITVRQRR